MVVFSLWAKTDQNKLSFSREQKCNFSTPHVSKTAVKKTTKIIFFQNWQSESTLLYAMFFYSSCNSFISGKFLKLIFITIF